MNMFRLSEQQQHLFNNEDSENGIMNTLDETPSTKLSLLCAIRKSRDGAVITDGTFVI